MVWVVVACMPQAPMAWLACMTVGHTIIQLANDQRALEYCFGEATTQPETARR